MTSRINEFFCQNLHIIKNFRQVEWNVTTFILCGFWMWAFNLTLQRMMEKNSCGKGDGRCFFCWKKHIFGILEVRLVNTMIPGHTVSRLKHKQLDRSFDQGLASMMKNCWQQLPPRCVFSCVFFSEVATFVLENAWSCGTNGQKSRCLKKNASMKLNATMFHQNPGFCNRD